MKKEIALHELLGLKQQEMAMILGVTRSQRSMYVLGKRDLPLEATLKLVQIIDYMNKPVEIMQEEQETNHDKRAKIQKIYKNLKIINQHRQLIIDKKLKAIEKKQNTAHKALKLVRFLETNQQNPSKIQLTIFDLIKNNATNEIEKNEEDV